MGPPDPITEASKACIRMKSDDYVREKEGAFGLFDRANVP